MEPTSLIHLNPTLEMIAGALEDAGFVCQRTDRTPEQSYRAVLPWGGRRRHDRDVLYLVSPEEAEGLAGEEYAFVSTLPIPGGASRLTVPGVEMAVLLNLLLDYFARLRDWEDRLNRLLFSDGSLDELCQLGQELTGCPVCIHDDWFILIAMSEGSTDIMPPEQVDRSGKGFVPFQILEEFKFDPEYEQTFTQQRCQLWVNASDVGRCLYVNLWQEARYRGRLLLFESGRSLRPLDYLMAECLAQRALYLMLRQKPGLRQHRNLDDVIYSLLQGTEPEPGDLRFLLSALKWGAEDSYLCIRLQSQREDPSGVMGHMLHSDLFRSFPGSYVMFLERQQCLVVNLSRNEQGLHELRHRLAPLCRDYCLYAGLSSPVKGIRDLSQAAMQSEIALARSFELRGPDWIHAFSDCALDYMLGCIRSEMDSRYMAAPEWLALRTFDRDHDTRYFDTLRAYLTLERDIPKTAKELIIHRTTLIYRLKKIEALTGLDLDNQDVRLYLLLSLRMLERQRLVEGG